MIFGSYHLACLGVNRSTGLPIRIRFSTTPLASPENVRIPVIKSSEIDYDYDGVNDQMETSIRFPLGPDEQIHSVKAAFLFDYKLRTSRGDSDISFLMEPGAIAIIQEQSVLPGDTLMTFGDLKLVQKEIRFLSGARSTAVFDVSLNDTFSWPDLVSKYFSLNDHVKYDHISTWTFQPPAVQSQGSTFTLKTIVNYSTDTVSYVPSVTELVKWIWIQYFCFLVPLALLIYPATIGFMVTTGVLQSTIKISGKDTAFKDYGF